MHVVTTAVLFVGAWREGRDWAWVVNTPDRCVPVCTDGYASWETHNK